MTPKIRNILQFSLFAILIIGIMLLGYKVYYQNNGDLIAVISLFIAVFSLIITTISLNINNDASLPQIVVDIDFHSRYSLSLLRIFNAGEKTAYDIRIVWDQQLKNHKGINITTLGDNENEMHIPVLQKGHQLKIVINKTTTLFKNSSDEKLKYSGKIKFKLNKSSKFELVQKFLIDLTPYKNTLNNDREELLAFFEMQKIPEILMGIKDEIKKLKQP